MIEPIGIVTLLVGAICLATTLRATISVFVTSALLGSSAAFLLGGANIQPGHVLLGFLVLAVVLRPHLIGPAATALRWDRPGFWLACLTIYGVCTAYFYPRIFAGLTQIIPLGTTEFDDTGATVPLTTVSSNFTHSVYQVADLLCFLAVSAIANVSRQGFMACIAALFAYAIGNTVFAVVDVATYYTGTEWLLSFIRNARYTLHTDVEVYGMKRIVGSFTEASSMGRSTLGVLGFTGTLWLLGYRTYLTGFLAAFSAVLLAVCTSSAALAGIPVMALLLYMTALGSAGLSDSRRNATATVLFVPPVVVAGALALLLLPDLFRTAYNYVDFVVLQKSVSHSGVERGSWNDIAMQNVIDTAGLGVGLGTVRTSGILQAVLANTGVLGAIFYALFFLLAVFGTNRIPASPMTGFRAAARNGFLGLMIGDLVVCPSIDQGLLFYTMAAVATAYPEAAEHWHDRLRTGAAA